MLYNVDRLLHTGIGLHTMQRIYFNTYLIKRTEQTHDEAEREREDKERQILRETERDRQGRS